MKHTQDRKRLRREYLRKKGGAYISMAIVLLVIVPTALMFLMFTFYIIWLLLFIHGERTSLHVVLGILAACLAPVTGFALWQFARDLRATKRKAGLIEYVPPVTRHSLAAEEVLVRAADEPAIAQSSVLLRAAQAAQETPKEELLRVSRGE